MKRFTATEKWAKTWFQELPPHLKCLWLYICDVADPAGVWDANFRMASFVIGKVVTLADLKAFGGRIVELDNGKLWISAFIDFQYGKLSKECRPHLKVFEALNRNGIEIHEDQFIVRRSRKSGVSEKQKRAVIERDGGKCVYCGSSDSLEPDHIVPRKKGGSDELGNLLTACHECNTKKSDKEVAEFLHDHPEKDRILAYLNTLSLFAVYPTTIPYHGRVQEEEEEEEEDKEEDKDQDKEKKERKGFDQFWQAYPKKLAKGDAEKAWRKQGCEPLTALILTKLEEFKASFDWKKEGGQYIPYPGTWLTRRSWGDEVFAPPSRIKSGTVELTKKELPKVWDPSSNGAIDK